MTPEKIAKLRELADRGVGGEKDNARAILTKNGIPWQKPKESFMNNVKKVIFRQDITRKYVMDFNNATDVLFLQQLCLTFIKHAVSTQLDRNIELTIEVTPGEYALISRFYTKSNRDSFSSDINRYARSQVSILSNYNY